MPRVRKLTPIQKQAIDLVRNGYSYGAAALELKVTRGVVAGVCHRHGVIGPRTGHLKRGHGVGPRGVKSGPRHHHCSALHAAILTKLGRHGPSLSVDIAESVGLSTASGRSNVCVALRQLVHEGRIVKIGARSRKGGGYVYCLASQPQERPKPADMSRAFDVVAEIERAALNPEGGWWRDPLTSNKKFKRVLRRAAVMEARSVGCSIAQIARASGTTASIVRAAITYDRLYPGSDTRAKGASR